MHDYMCVVGGFWCWDEATCDGRYKTSIDLMSSSQWPQSVNFGGILSQDAPLNPAFHNASMVYGVVLGCLPSSVASSVAQ